MKGEDKMKETKNLVLDDGTVIPEKQRTRCEIWSRPVGYLRPVQHWNNGKKQEFEERKTFKVDEYTPEYTNQK
jgi:anaerobic ribonucleoside-triphosphate reductase